MLFPLLIFVSQLLFITVISLQFCTEKPVRVIHKFHFALQISLAAQTLSASTAKALDFVHDLKYPGFDEVDATIFFVETIDRLFDILNSRRPNAPGFIHVEPSSREEIPEAPRRKIVCVYKRRLR